MLAKPKKVIAKESFSNT